MTPEEQANQQQVLLMRTQLAQVTAERDAFILGGVTEDLLRKHDGYIKIGRGCCVTLEDEWLAHQRQLAERDATIAQLEADLAEGWRVMEEVAGMPGKDWLAGQLQLADHLTTANTTGSNQHTPKEGEPGYGGGGWIPCVPKEKP
jgi:hypothetical protein